MEKQIGVEMTMGSFSRITLMFLRFQAIPVLVMMTT